MDSLTQIVLGAAVAEATIGKKVGNKAILWGAIAGTIPDLDVFVKYFVEDDLVANEMHRGFSHSILFSLIFAPIIGWIISRIYTSNEADWKDWSKAMFWSLVTHPLLDAHTNWGTQLFWPFELRVAYNNIFVVDPLYTIPFMIFVIIAMCYKRQNPKRAFFNRIGLIVSSSYMLLTIVVKGYVFNKFTSSLDKQGIEYQRVSTNPTPFNNILWIALVEKEKEYLVGYYSLLDKTNDIHFITLEKNRNSFQDITNELKVQKLIRLSKDWYVMQEKENKLYFYDLRFGMMGMGDQMSLDQLVFCYELDKIEGKMIVRQVQRDFKDIGNVFGSLIKRVKGI